MRKGCICFENVHSGNEDSWVFVTNLSMLICGPTYVPLQYVRLVLCGNCCCRPPWLTLSEHDSLCCVISLPLLPSFILPPCSKGKKAGEELQITSMQHRNLTVIQHSMHTFGVCWIFVSMTTFSSVAICQYPCQYLKKTSIFPLPMLKHLKWKTSFIATAQKLKMQ